ncbi:MAG: hypothetical protein JXO48_09320 [Deltaproteobacteria bacterium]|nr:hypothetical protein [Deltaproteobacteria bacterium]
MNDIGFHKETTRGTYLDPFNGFQSKESSFEIRRDDTTGVTCRILPFRFSIAEKPDLNAYIEKSPDSICPFCTALFDQMTPRFTPDVHREGKFKRGSAVLFPNAFPYDGNNAVAIFSHEHFLGLDVLRPEVMEDGFLVCRDYFERMSVLDSSLRFCSINWNYMPPAGGGLIHPHLQTIVSGRPTRFMERLLRKGSEHRRRTGRNLWDDLVSYERKENERFIAERDNVVWLATFAPKGMAGEVSFIFNGKISLFDLHETDWTAFTGGLFTIFRYFQENNFISFNMAIFATLTETDDFRVQGKILPRFLLPPLGTSDLNYFEKLHDEIICPTIPEALCEELRKLF